MSESVGTSSRLVWLNAGLGLVTGLIGFGVLQAAYPFFSVPAEFDIGMGASSEARMALLNQTHRVEGQNTLVILAICGGVLATALAAITSGCCALPIRLIAGILWGTLSGAAVGWLGHQATMMLVPRSAIPSLTNVGAAHGLLFGLLGLCLGAMLGGFTKNSQVIGSKILSGSLAGAAGGFLYAVIVGFVAPGENASQLIPANSVAQALWLCLPLTAIGAGLGYVVPPKNVDTVET